MLMVTTTVGMLHWVHSHTTHLQDNRTDTQPLLCTWHDTCPASGAPAPAAWGLTGDFLYYADHVRPCCLSIE